MSEDLSDIIRRAAAGELELTDADREAMGEAAAKLAPHLDEIREAVKEITEEK